VCSYSKLKTNLLTRIKINGPTRLPQKASSSLSVIA